MFESGKSPPGTVFTFDEWRGFRTIFGNHLGPVTLDFLAYTQRHAAKQHDFGEARRNLKTRVAIFRLVFLDGSEPFQRMAQIVVFSMGVARDAFGKLRHRRVLEVMDVFLVALKLYKKARSVIVWRKDRASVANQERTAVGDFTAQRNDVGSEFNRRLVAEVMAVAG